MFRNLVIYIFVLSTFRLLTNTNTRGLCCYFNSRTEITRIKKLCAKKHVLMNLGLFDWKLSILFYAAQLLLSLCEIISKKFLPDFTITKTILLQYVSLFAIWHTKKTYGVVVLENGRYHISHVCVFFFKKTPG